MSINTPLFQGKRVRLGPIDHENDPEIVSHWTHDAGFMRMMYTDQFRPLSVSQVKNNLEALEKSIDEDKNWFHFRIRSLSENRLIGFAEIMRISWSNANGYIRFGIGAEADRHQGYGGEVLDMLLRYTFDELNLFRLTALIPEYNLHAEALFKRKGFIKEVCRREALMRDTRKWDLLHYGILGEEWRENIL